MKRSIIPFKQKNSNLQNLVHGIFFEEDIIEFIIINSMSIPFASTLKLAEKRKRRHKDVLASVRKVVSTLGHKIYVSIQEFITERESSPSVGLCILAQTYLDESGKSNIYYLLDRDAYLTCSPFLGGRNSIITHAAFVERFSHYEKLLLNPPKANLDDPLPLRLESLLPQAISFGHVTPDVRQQIANCAIEIRRVTANKSLADKIFACINLAVLGTSGKKLRDALGLRRHERTRDALNHKQQELIDEIQLRVVRWLSRRNESNLPITLINALETTAREILSVLTAIDYEVNGILVREMTTSEIRAWLKLDKGEYALVPLPGVPRLQLVK